MPHKTDDPRVLAIDLRTMQFGYAVFEGPKQLLDWGRCTYPGGDAGPQLAAKRFAELLRLFHPAMVVIQKERRTGVRNTSEIASILSAIRQEAAARSVPICFVTPEQIKAAFRIFRGSTKDEIAYMLTSIFPELLWKLPPKRKTWKREHPRMMVFDAIAAGFTYWQRNGARAPPS